MYPVSQTTINQYIAGGAESVSLTVTPVNASPFVISNNNLKSFQLDRYCCSGNTIEIGSAIASEINFVLENTNGTYDNVVFEGAEVYATTQLRNGTIIPLGYFTIDNSPRKLSTITLTALDRMVMLDKYATNMTYPVTIATLISTICTRCGVTLGTQVTNTYQVKEPTTTDVTYRQLLQWACQILGCNAYFDWAGQLKIGTYSTSSVLTLDKSVRYKSDVYENAITITGVQYTDEESTHIVGTTGYVIDISSNELVDNINSALTQIFSVVGNFSYYPYNCSTKSFPFLYPMDSVTVVDNKGNNVRSIVSNITYYLNRNNELKAVGLTDVQKGYAKLNPLTSTEIKIIENISAQTAQEEIDDRTAFLIDQNKTIANSLGLYVIEQQTVSGKIYYYCNEPTLADSSIIYTFRANGFAWTDDWNDGNPTWYYGFTRDGNAIVNILSAYKITADQLSITGAITFADLNTSTQNRIIDAETDASDAVTTANNASDVATAASGTATAAQTTANGIVNNIYYTGTTYIDGTKIYTHSITANQIDATNLHVNAANIDGTLTAGALSVVGSSQSDTGSITGNNSGLNINTTSTTSCSISLGYSGDMSLRAPDGTVSLYGQSVNIESALGDVYISSTNGGVSITNGYGSFDGTLAGTFAGDVTASSLIVSDYGTTLPPAANYSEGSVFFLLV